MSDSYYDFIFETERFNLSQPKENFINPTCFGDDAAQWLLEQLKKEGAECAEIGQEDWGWYLCPSFEGHDYFIAVSGTTDENPASPNQGEWRISVMKHRSLKEKLLGFNKITLEDPLIAVIRSILGNDSSIHITDTESSV